MADEVKYEDLTPDQQFAVKYLCMVKDAKDQNEIKDAFAEMFKEAKSLIEMYYKAFEELSANVRILTTAMYNALGWEGESEEIPDSKDDGVVSMILTYEEAIENDGHTNAIVALLKNLNATADPASDKASSVGPIVETEGGPND